MLYAQKHIKRLLLLLSDLVDSDEQAASVLNYLGTPSSMIGIWTASSFRSELPSALMSLSVSGDIPPSNQSVEYYTRIIELIKKEENYAEL